MVDLQDNDERAANAERRRRSEFARLAVRARYVPVYQQLTSDTLTPVTAYRRLCSDADWSFLFESVVGGEKIGRYSFVGCHPFRWLSALGDQVTVWKRHEGAETRQCDDPLVELDRMVAEFSSVAVPGLPAFTSGAVGYAAYDSIRYTEHLPNVPDDDRHLPDLCFGFYDSVLIFDHINKMILAVALADVGEQVESERDEESGEVAKWTEPLNDAWNDANTRLATMIDQLAVQRSDLSPTPIDLHCEIDAMPESNFTQPEFEAAVEKCREYIQAGDVFQVVISQRLKMPSRASALDIYRSLRMVNPSPFMFLLRTPDVELVGSSPEIMVRVEDRETTIRPLAGTRKRGRTPKEDDALAAELLADPKERAEHVMLIDLARNDVGRVVDPGSVNLSDVMVVERYSHVMHITSNVTGMLREELSAIEALRAGLPAGTVSGAPKVRAMEIIDEIEPHKRGPYGGAVGYIDFTGNMDTCIALRTLVICDGYVYMQAGAGIVADSVPENEYHETLSKARGLLKAIHVAETQLAGDA